METSIKNSLDAVTLLATASSYTDEVRRDSIADKLPSDIKNCINSTEPNHASDKLFGDQLTKKVSEWKMVESTKKLERIRQIRTQFKKLVSPP